MPQLAMKRRRRWTMRKDNDLPWLDNKAKQMIKKKKAIYKLEGASERWTKILDKLEST